MKIKSSIINSVIAVITTALGLTILNAILWAILASTALEPNAIMITVIIEVIEILYSIYYIFYKSFYNYEVVENHLIVRRKNKVIHDFNTVEGELLFSSVQRGISTTSRITYLNNGKKVKLNSSRLGLGGLEEVKQYVSESIPVSDKVVTKLEVEN